MSVPFAMDLEEDSMVICEECVYRTGSVMKLLSYRKSSGIGPIVDKGMH